MKVKIHYFRGCIFLNIIFYNFFVIALYWVAWEFCSYYLFKQKAEVAIINTHNFLRFANFPRVSPCPSCWQITFKDEVKLFFSVFSKWPRNSCRRRTRRVVDYRRSPPSPFSDSFPQCAFDQKRVSDVSRHFSLSLVFSNVVQHIRSRWNVRYAIKATRFESINCPLE